MQLVKSETHDCSRAIKVGFTDISGDRRFKGEEPEDIRNIEAYELGQHISSRGLARPWDCICHILPEGRREYVVRSDTYQTGAVFFVKANGDGKPYRFVLVHKSALEAGYR